MLLDPGTSTRNLKVPVAYCCLCFHHGAECREGCSNHAKGNIKPFAVAVAGAAEALASPDLSTATTNEVAPLTVSVGSGY